MIDLANRYDVAVLWRTRRTGELRFEGEQVPTLKSLDTEGRVIHLGSFSKTIAPGLRMGWAVARPDILEKLGLLKLAADTQSSTLNMNAVAAFLERLQISMRTWRAPTLVPDRRQARRDACGAMDEHFPEEVTFTRPQGGLFTWVTFPEGFDSAAFMAKRALPEARVAYVPGETFFPTGGASNHARFSYSGVPEDQMIDAIRRLGGMLKDELVWPLHDEPERRGPPGRPGLTSSPPPHVWCWCGVAVSRRSCQTTVSSQGQRSADVIGDAGRWPTPLFLMHPASDQNPKLVVTSVASTGIVVWVPETRLTPTDLARNPRVALHFTPTSGRG